MTADQIKRDSEQISGVSNIAYNLIAMLHNKLDAIAALEIYKQDARDDQEVRQLFEQMQRQDVERVAQLKSLLASRLK